MTYNGIVPGPEIRVTEGDNVRVIVHNEPGRKHLDPLARRDRPQQHGRRAVPHSVPDQARRDVHV
ncbi:MAG: multicopper oxidase domain-containing protein [Chloroflexi bacterium]|nr:multicopper oxidase domain-containing protein [Chloroflexota bacterium]